MWTEIWIYLVQSCYSDVKIIYKEWNEVWENLFVEWKANKSQSNSALRIFTLIRNSYYILGLQLRQPLFRCHTNASIFNTICMDGKWKKKHNRNTCLMADTFCQFAASPLEKLKFHRIKKTHLSLNRIIKVEKEAKTIVRNTEVYVNFCYRNSASANAINTR